MEHVIGYVGTFDHAVFGVMRLLQQGGNVWLLHEPIACGGAPEIGGGLFYRQPIGILDPRDRSRDDVRTNK
jgi:hypothetical protein